MSSSSSGRKRRFFALPPNLSLPSTEQRHCQGIPGRVLHEQQECARTECVQQDGSLRGRPVTETARGDTICVQSQGGDRGQADHESEELGTMLDLCGAECDPVAVHETFDYRGFRILAGVSVLLGQDRAVQLFLE